MTDRRYVRDFNVRPCEDHVEIDFFPLGSIGKYVTAEDAVAGIVIDRVHAGLLQALLREALASPVVKP